MIPDHGFHPAVVHFPIALFIFGAGLEVVAWRLRSDFLGRAALLNMVGALVSTALVVPSGVLAYRGADYTWSGGIVPHVLLASTALLLMTVAVLTRRRTQPSQRSVLLALLAALAVGAAGHFGGQLIYGI
jgi:uncharacterized membrane protein